MAPCFIVLSLTLLVLTITGASLQNTAIEHLIRVTRQCQSIILIEAISGLMDEILRIQGEYQMPSIIQWGYDPRNYYSSQGHLDSARSNRPCSIHIALPRGDQWAGHQRTQIPLLGSPKFLNYLKRSMDPIKDIFVLISSQKFPTSIRKEFLRPPNLPQNFMVIGIKETPGNIELRELLVITEACSTHNPGCVLPSNFLQQGNFFNLLSYFKSVQAISPRSAVLLQGSIGNPELKVASILATRFNFTIHENLRRSGHFGGVISVHVVPRRPQKQYQVVLVGEMGFQMAYTEKFEKLTTPLTEEWPEWDLTILLAPFDNSTWLTIILTALLVSTVISLRPRLNSVLNVLVSTPAALLWNRIIVRTNHRTKLISALLIFCFFLISSTYKNYFLLRGVVEVDRAWPNLKSMGQLLDDNYTLTGPEYIKQLIRHKLIHRISSRSKFYSALQNMQSDVSAEVFREGKYAVLGISLGWGNFIEPLGYGVRHLRIARGLLFEEWDTWIFQLRNSDVAPAFSQLQSTGVYHYWFRGTSGTHFDGARGRGSGALWRPIKLMDVIVVAALACHILGLIIALLVFLTLEPFVYIVGRICCRTKRK
ncbi:unnamed protein product [Allacma fusca]|uniref:Uncharacterized protein n=1 Tax=Allacma fusca TaxID=39272 RepID=A0A8J2PQM4_9HEXA|nr:unnamed protein product [Allacma fusca]